MSNETHPDFRHSEGDGKELLRFGAQLKAVLLKLDEMLISVCLSVPRESGSLLIFLFHSLFQDGDDAWAGVMDPQQGITVDMLREFLLHFKEQGYRFVSPDDIVKGLEPRGKNVLVTFDDGYYNNVRALPILEQFRIPAVFFISSDYAKHERAFWWDVVFREFRKRHRTDGEIRSAIARFKRLKTAAVESDLNLRFGESALKPVTDLDRPFRPSELKNFAKHPLVSLGNHTKGHAILTNYSDEEVGAQIEGAQNDIFEMTGKRPEIIAYPNGNISPAIQAIAWNAGLRLGIGTSPGKNRLPLRIDTGEAMMMKRFTLWGDRGIDTQCRVSRSRLSLYRSFEGIRTRIHTVLPPAPRST
jgi:peptidoglycan/xylan/chitin deacetylase (PgdA/CDA1 family)